MKSQRTYKMLFAGCVMAMLCSCGAEHLKPSDYVAWSDNTENNLVRVYEQGVLRLTCQYTTPEYVSLKQSDAANLDEEQLKDNIASISDMVHFKLRFQDTTSANFLQNNYTTPQEFNTRSMYLSYDIRYDLKMVQDGDTADCVLNHHERTYGSTPYETVLLSFPRIRTNACDTELIFNDRVFGLGRVKFFFPQEDLESIPQLAME